MAQTNRILLTGGTYNRVLCAHSQMCHHCGYIGGGEVSNVCSECGRQSHSDCVPRFSDGVCDGCRHPDHVCEICNVDDDDVHDAPPNGVDRLIPLVVFHGRRWSRGGDDDAERAWLPEDSEVARRLAVDPETRFQPSQLPVRGDRPLRVVVDGVCYRSHPMMVHSWCAQSAFQFHPAPPGAQSWHRVVEAIDAPRRCEYAETSTQRKLGVVNAAAGCAFCGSSNGFQIFCYGHTNSTRGCTNCNWKVRPHFTYTSFHPSCAVRAGMYRVIDPANGGAGMMCCKSMAAFLPKVHRMNRTRDAGSRVARVERWLTQSSGFHMDLASRVDPSSLTMDISQTLPTLGARYDAVPPLVAHRVVRKRHRSKSVHCGVAQIMEHVSEQPSDRSHHTQAASRAQREDSRDGRDDQQGECSQDRAQTDEFPNGTVAPAVHSSTPFPLPMTLEESTELIRMAELPPRFVEALDVRIAAEVSRALSGDVARL